MRSVSNVDVVVTLRLSHVNTCGVVDFPESTEQWWLAQDENGDVFTTDTLRAASRFPSPAEARRALGFLYNDIWDAFAEVEEAPEENAR